MDRLSGPFPNTPSDLVRFMAKEVGRFVSGVVILDYARGRFTLPADVLRSVGWDDLADEEVLIAEFVDIGHIRLHRKAHIATQTARIAERIRKEVTSPQEQETCLQVLWDRFRDVVFYRSDNNRVTMKAEVTMALAGLSASIETSQIYLQARERSIDIMTHAVRIARLRSLVLPD